MLYFASCTLLEPGPFLGPEMLWGGGGGGGVFYWMDRNLLSIRAVPKRVIFCSSLMFAAWIFSKLFTTTKDPKKH